MKYKKNLKILLTIIVCTMFVLCSVLIYGMGNQKNLAKKSHDIFKENNESEEELIKDLEILENFDILVNLDFFEDLMNESE